MYDIHTLISAPDAFSSKPIATTLRAFGDKTNTVPLRQSTSRPLKSDRGPPSRFPSRKASATVALTSTTALRTSKPLSSMPLDSSQEGENAILFPTLSAGETTVAPPGLKRPLPIEPRRRRTGALVPPSARASVTAVTRPIAKRPRKNKHVLADLQFSATVHRSIVALHVETECRQSVTLDSGLDSMDIDDGSGIRDAMVERVREELRGLDQQLVVRLAQRLHLSGCASTLMDATPAMIENRHLPLSCVPQEGTRAPPPSPEMETGRDAMDVTLDPLPASPTSPCVHRLTPLPTVPPSQFQLLDNPVPLCSPPGLVSPRVPSQVSAEKRVYTMSQLVATHILRLHERGNARTPNFHPRTLRIRSPLSNSIAR
ncbi:hypothetical protein BGW80DRAFT_1257902 [Lactifluus volemus]|nr:hypothetical protein BGW80DRAFT_1257902 [Lactifluus volemus]